MTEPIQHTLQVPGAEITYDVRGPLPAADGRPVLLLIGQPMDARGFATLASLLSERTVVTYDPRGLGRSGRSDGRTDNVPAQHAADLHLLIEALGAGPVEVFGSSGGAVDGLALAQAHHPADVSTLVAHEPPIWSVLPDADQVAQAQRAMVSAYHEGGFGPAMARFIALTSWQGKLTDEFWAHSAPAPAAYGLPIEDDGSRDDPLLSGASDAVTAFQPDVAALTAAPTRIIVAAGAESGGSPMARAAAALADRLDAPLAVFPGDHGGFFGGEFGQRGVPEEFAARLREVLAAPLL